MPAFVVALVGLLVQVAGTLVGQVLLSLGIGYTVFTGVSVSIGWVRTQFVDGFTSAAVPAAAVQFMAMLKLGTVVSMLLAALTVRLAIAGLTSGALTRMVQGAPK